MTAPAEALCSLVGAAREELVLCAPFAKKGTVDRLLQEARQGLRLTMITRWRPEEVAAGVTDLEVLDVISGRGGRVVLHDRLHAKYYRSESQTLLGSANLTATALGWAATSNLELLVPSNMEDVERLEAKLLAEGIDASNELADQVRAQALELVPLPRVEDPDHSDEVPLGWAEWLPSLRHPADLFRAYMLGLEELATTSRANARLDLAWLELPAGLDEHRFVTLVGARLMQHPTLRDLDAFLAEERRFGAVRDFLATNRSLSSNEAEVAWQTLMRWLLMFLPHRYAVRTYNWSEVVYRTDPKGTER